MTNALIINRSEYVLGLPRLRFFGGTGIGIRSTSDTKMTSNGFCCSIQLPPGLVGVQLQYYGGRRTLARPSCGVFYL